MAISSYADLIAAVRDWLGRANDSAFLPDTRVGDLIAAAEAEIYARLRVRQMETAIDLTVDEQTIDLPADFMEIRRVYLDGTPIRNPIYMAPSQFWAEFNANLTSIPRAYTIEGSSIAFGPTPDQVYTGKLLYYARPAALSTATNSIFIANPDLFLYGALTHAGIFTGSEDAPRVAGFQQAFAQALNRVQAQSDRAVSGAPLTIRAG